MLPGRGPQRISQSGCRIPRRGGALEERTLSRRHGSLRGPLRLFPPKGPPPSQLFQRRASQVHLWPGGHFYKLGTDPFSLDTSLGKLSHKYIFQSRAPYCQIVSRSGGLSREQCPLQWRCHGQCGCLALHSGRRAPEAGLVPLFSMTPSPCILGTHHEKGAQTFWSVVNRLPLSSNAMLCWKFCHVFHKVLRDGHPNVSPWGCGGGWAPPWVKRSPGPRGGPRPHGPFLGLVVTDRWVGASQLASPPLPGPAPASSGHPFCSLTPLPLPLQVLKDSLRYKNELSDMSRMWVSLEVHPEATSCASCLPRGYRTRTMGWTDSLSFSLFRISP